MELGVLELGLKNQQISNVRCFLKIQTEAFRVKWKEFLANDGPNRGETIDGLSLLLSQWKVVYSKVSPVIDATLKDTASSANRDFGTKLARIALQTSNQLLLILSTDISEEQTNEGLNAMRDMFLEKLMESIKDMRLAVARIKFEPLHNNEKRPSIADLKVSTAWTGLTPKEVITNSIDENRIPLAQFWLIVNDKKSESSWKYVLETSFEVVMSHLKNNDINKARNALENVKLSVDESLFEIFVKTFDNALRTTVGLHIRANISGNKRLNHQLLNVLDTIFELNPKEELQLSISAIESVDDFVIKSLLVAGLMVEENTSLSSKCLDMVSSQLTKSYLLESNDFGLLYDWIRCADKECAEPTKFPFGWKLSRDMAQNYPHYLQKRFREEMLDALGSKGLFNEREQTSANLILKRLLRSRESEAGLHLMNYSSHPLHSSSSSVSFASLQKQLIEFAAKNHLYDYLLWYSTICDDNVLKSSQINDKMRDVLLLFSEYTSNTSVGTTETLNVMLQLARYLYEFSSPVSIEKLIECNLEKLAILCLQYSPFGNVPPSESNPEQIWFVSKSSLLKAFKSLYPLLYKSLTMASNSAYESDYSQETPSVYSLLKGTTVFDASKLFRWQSTNQFRNSNDSLIAEEIPHFSHNRLAGLHGLKANLTFLYFLSEGRPFEAFLKRSSRKSSTFSSKRIESGCKKSALVAYYNCLRPEVAAAAVTFQELLKNDSLSLRLHLSVAHLIVSHAANFLGLTPRDQLTVVGSLLKRASYYDEKSAPVKLLELLVTAFSRKYDNRKELLVEECLEWKLAIAFCKEYKLEKPVDFLKKCAESDEWLLFIVFAQMYDYPVEVIVKLLEEFNNKCISDHIEKALLSSTCFNEDDSHPQSIIKGSRRKNTSSAHIRNTLYNRIGLKQGLDPSRLIPGQPPRTSSPSSFEEDIRSNTSDNDMTNVETISIMSGSVLSDYFEGVAFEQENLPKDLFSVLLLCQKANPAELWKSLLSSSISLSNPILSLLASSVAPEFLDDVEFSCFCCWLLSSFDLPSKSAHISSEPYFINWGEHDFYSLLKSSLVIPTNFSTLLVGLTLFECENNPLTELIQFFIEFLVEKDYHKSVHRIKGFQDQLWKYEGSQDNKFLLNTKKLVEETAVIIFQSGLEAAENPYELHILLRHLDLARVQCSFSAQVKVPDFRKLYSLSQKIRETDIEINVSEFINFDEESEHYVNASKRVIYALQERLFFVEALQFASVSGISLEDISLSEWHIKVSSDKESLQLWRECLDSLEKANIPLLAMIAFLKKFIDQIKSSLIKCYLLVKLCYYAIELELDKNEWFECEILLWTSVLQIEGDSGLGLNDNRDWNDIWVSITGLENNWKYTSEYAIESNEEGRGRKGSCSIPPEKLPLLDQLIGKLVTTGCVQSAYKVSALFNHYSKDLDIINVCSNIAKGKYSDMSPIKLENILSKLVTDEDSGGSSLTQPFATDNISHLLERVAGFGTYGKIACQRIILFYKISCILGGSYVEITKAKSNVSLIRSLIHTQPICSDSIGLAKELIVMNSISDEEVSQLICSEILETLRSGCSDNASIESCISGAETNNFLALLRLLNDPSVLGRKLMEIVKNGSIDDLSLCVAVEVYVKAHECFTLSCDIEGISVVLRTVKNLVMQHLSTNNDYPSMIRLLTGIGRYSEMTYIFDILKESYQFEVLLGKKIAKVPQLRVALLDSLKGDKEMYPMVALNFSMHREIAEMLEADAIRILRNINLRQQLNPMSFRDVLERVLHDLVDASDSYNKASCYNHANSCGKLAELVALQINYLPSGLVILNMTESAVADFVCKHPKCLEAIIVAEAYNHQRGWATAIFNNVVLRGDWAYFRELQTYMQVSSSNLEEIAAKYLQEKAKKVAPEKLLVMNASMQRLLTHCHDLGLQLTLCLQIGFVEMAAKLLQEENRTYLRDLQRKSQL